MEIQELYNKYVGTLLPDEQLRLVEIIVNRLGNKMSQEPKSSQSVNSLSDWEKSQKWLEEHQEEYANQWVALVGDKLLASGKEARDVYQSAVRQGVHTPFLARVEDVTKREGHHFGGWQ